MPRKSPQEIAEKYGRRAGAASADYVEGIQGVSEHPGQAAVRNSQGYIQGVQNSFETWRGRTANYDMNEWKRNAEEASGAYSAGVQGKGQRKQEEFWREFGPHLDNVTSRVRAMPAATPQDREARMLAQVRGTRDFRRRSAR